MATATLVPVREYLSTSFEYEAEYVRGEVIERGMPNAEHGFSQGQFIVAFSRYRDRGLWGLVAVRLRLAEDLYRIPDFCLFAGFPASLPSEPPLLVAEIVSPDDRWHQVIEKLREYRAWGVLNVLLADPETKTLFVFDGKMHPVDVFELPGYDVRITGSELFL